jgi:hypothetical protein
MTRRPNTLGAMHRSNMACGQCGWHCIGTSEILNLIARMSGRRILDIVPAD